MIERGFLISRGYTAIGAYKLNSLLEETDEILRKIEINDKRITNGEISHLQIVWESVEEILGNEDLRDRFYFDIEKARRKLKQYLDR